VIKRELQRHLAEHGSEQLNVAPRKPNWDLKRDVAKKMEKLNRLTQKAIVELLREKLAREAEEGSSDEEEDDEEDDE
jgi:coiled-coil domain-containing protein 12